MRGRISLAVALAGAVGACDARVGDDVVSVSSALLSNQTVLGFESTSGWTISGGSIALSTTHSQGTYSVKASGVTSGSLISQALTTLSGVTTTIGFDVRLPTTQPNATYYGQIELHINLPSQGVYDAFVGLKLLQPPFPLGSFQTVELMIPTGSSRS